MVWAVFEAIGAAVLCYYLPRAAYLDLEPNGPGGPVVASGPVGAQTGSGEAGGGSDSDDEARAV